jgi:hypothetical protein
MSVRRAASVLITLQQITKWDGDILSYKEHLRKQIRKSLKAAE